MEVTRRRRIVGGAVAIIVLGIAGLALRATSNGSGDQLANLDNPPEEQQAVLLDSQSRPQPAAIGNSLDVLAIESESEPELIDEVLTTAPSGPVEKPATTEPGTSSTKPISTSEISTKQEPADPTVSQSGSSQTTERQTTSSQTPTTQTTPSQTTAQPSSSVAYSGVSSAQWNEIAAQRAQFGDSNDCQARVSSISYNADIAVSPGDAGAIQRSLDSGAQVVLLQGGTHRAGGPIRIGSGQQLVGANGQSVTIDASGAATGVSLGSNSILANISVVNADNVGVSFGASGLAYRVSVKRAGYSSTVNSSGAGFSMHGSESTNNCLVSAEALEGFNEDGNTCAPCFNGGNADGVAVKFEARSNTIIDTHTYRNSDDGYDFWEGGSNYVYFGSSFDNGKTPNRPNGDGNGYKLGRGNATHYLYKVRAYTNVADGIDLNGNASTAVLVQTESTGNGGTDFDQVANS